MSVRSRSLAVAAALLTGVAAFVLQARASSDEAWGAFRASVETACRAAGEGVLDTAGVTVDPFGSERFGIAVLQGNEKGGGARRSAGGGARRRASRGVWAMPRRPISRSWSPR